MKTKWQFLFSCEGFRLDKSRKFKAVIPADRAEAMVGADEAFDAQIEFCPDETPYDERKSQTGSLFITLPGDHVATESAATSLAIHLASKINFDHPGGVHIEAGLVTAEMLPESDEEEASLGEGRYFVRARLVEVAEDQVFSASSLETPLTSPLVYQYVEAARTTNPIDSYLALFRIIEVLFGARPLKTTLANSVELFKLAQAVLGIADHSSFESLVQSLVDMRHECAHLRPGFGIQAGDARIETDLRPLLQQLGALAKEAVRVHGSGVP